MNIWTPLPPDTNTLYVAKLDPVASGQPLTWSPDPGTRVKIRYGSWTITTPAVGAVRQPRWRLLYGSDVVAVYVASYGLVSNKTNRISLGKYYRAAYGAGEIEANLYWDSDVYLTSDFALELGANWYEAGDQYADGVLYLDAWNDMMVRGAEKE